MYISHLSATRHTAHLYMCMYMYMYCVYMYCVYMYCVYMYCVYMYCVYTYCSRKHARTCAQHTCAHSRDACGSGARERHGALGAGGDPVGAGGRCWAPWALCAFQGCSYVPWPRPRCLSPQAPSSPPAPAPSLPDMCRRPRRLSVYILFIASL